jgi:hypothetical protein
MEFNHLSSNRLPFWADTIFLWRCFMYVFLTDSEWFQLYAIQDKGFHKALMRSEFSWIDQDGKWQVNIYWLFPWAYSDSCGNPRFSDTAVKIRASWQGHAWFDKDVFLLEARQRRY